MPLPSTTTSLIDSLKADETVAWATFSQVYVPVIFALCERYAGDQAEQLTQEIVDRIRDRMCDFERREDGRFRHYLKQVTFSRISDCQRAQKRNAAKLEKSTFDAKFSEFEIRSAIHIVRRKRRFDSNSWMAFELRTKEKLTYPKIAAKLNISEDAARKAANRIISAVRKELESIRQR